MVPNKFEYRNNLMTLDEVQRRLEGIRRNERRPWLAEQIGDCLAGRVILRLITWFSFNSITFEARIPRNYDWAAAGDFCNELRKRKDFIRANAGLINLFNVTVTKYNTYIPLTRIKLVKITPKKVSLAEGERRRRAIEEASQQREQVYLALAAQVAESERAAGAAAGAQRRMQEQHRIAEQTMQSFQAECEREKVNAAAVLLLEQQRLEAARSDAREVLRAQQERMAADNLRATEALRATAAAMQIEQARQRDALRLEEAEKKRQQAISEALMNAQRAITDERLVQVAQSKDALVKPASPPAYVPAAAVDQPQGRIPLNTHSSNALSTQQTWQQEALPRSAPLPAALARVDLNSAERDGRRSQAAPVPSPVPAAPIPAAASARQTRVVLSSAENDGRGSRQAQAPAHIPIASTQIPPAASAPVPKQRADLGTAATGQRTSQTASAPTLSPFSQQQQQGRVDMGSRAKRR